MSSNWNPNFVSLTSQECKPDHCSPLNEDTNKKQFDTHQNTENTLLNPLYEQNFEEKDDYSLSYIFTAGLRYCAAHKRNHPKMQTWQALIRDGISEKGIKANGSDHSINTNNDANKLIAKDQGLSPNDGRTGETNSGHLDPLFSHNFSNMADEDLEVHMNSLRDLTGNSKHTLYNIEGKKSNVECYLPERRSSICFEALHGTNVQVDGASTLKALHHAHGSNSSNSNKMKGKPNIAPKPPRPPTSHGISRFAPTNNTGKRKMWTMAERAHPVKDARKGNQNDFSNSKVMGSERSQLPHLKMFQINQTEGEGTNDMNTNSSIKSSSTVSHVLENQSSVTKSPSMKTPTMSDVTDHGEADMNSNFDNWFDNVLINDQVIGNAFNG